MANAQLNADVYAHLLSFVSSPNDLLAVSLANKELLNLAEPEVIYRSIRCKLNNNAVWEHLISNPVQASRVRELAIQREINISRLQEGERIPEGSYLDSDNVSGQVIPDWNPSNYRLENAEHSERLLIRAIQNMVNLERFTWDRWVPLINQGEEVSRVLAMADGRQDGGDEPPETYREDIWTVLRDHTQVKRLEVVDLGQVKTLFPDSRPIFNSTIFTLRNLTHLDLRIYYSPDDEFEGTRGFEDDDDHNYSYLFPGRVKIARLQDLLTRCPNLESLSLAIVDRKFYNFLDGNPFTNITPIISNSYWPHLTSLAFEDILIDGGAMANFLRIHPNLRMLKACLTLDNDDLPHIPFNLPSDRDSIQGILPRLEHLNVPCPTACHILQAMKRPCSLQSIAHLEPHDWNAGDDDRDENIVSSLDDVWGSPTESLQEIGDGPLYGRDFHNLLFGMPDLNKLVVHYVTNFRQLDKLVKSTPNLQHIAFQGNFMTSQFTRDTRLHDQVLPYLSRWTKLISCTGACLWPSNETLELSSADTLSIAREILRACPLIRELSWLNGHLVKLVVGGDGELIRLEPGATPGHRGD